MRKTASEIAKANHKPGEREKIAVITGCSSGIGLYTLTALAHNGFKVYGGVRDIPKMENLMKSLSISRDSFEFSFLDLTDFATVKQFAIDLLVKLTRIDVLILNAGFYPTEWVTTKDGYEKCFQTCHLSHHLLVRLLEERLIQSAPSRVIFVASAAHMMATEYDWPTATKKGFNSDETSYSFSTGMKLYSTAKIANIHDALVLGKRLEGKGISVFALHPGGVDSNIWPKWVVGRRFYMMSSDAGAACSVHLATCPKLENSKAGTYWVPSRFWQLPHKGYSSALARNEKVAQRLWEESEKILKSYL